MGADTNSRREADKTRTLKPRKAGNPKVNKFPLFTLIIPTWMIRELSDTEDPIKAEEFIRQYEFIPEITKEGILYRPTKTTKIEGW